jgi:putative peptidoglycan lipid II flippase
MSAPPQLALPVNRRILRAAASVGVAGILVKLVATLKEVAVAGVYGRSDAMDAFLVAALIPTLLVNLVAESMNQALVPTLIRVREREGRESAERLFASCTLWLCLLLATASVLILLTSHAFFPLLAAEFPPAKLALSRQLFYALVPIVLMTGIATHCTAVLNSFERFVLPALAPVVISLSIIVGALGFGARFGIVAMVWATLFGSLAHVVLVVGMMARHGYRFRLRWYGMTEPVREVGRQYGPVLLSGVVSSGGLLVDQAMAAMLVSGSVAALAYANRFVSVVLTLFAGAISTAIIPYFSQMVAHSDWRGCRASVHYWLRRTALVSVPVALMLIAGARPLVRIFFEHGAFHAADTEVVTRVLRMYALQIPFYIVSRVDYRLLVALRRTDLIFWCGTINLALDVLLNLLFMRWLGVAGIALATSVWTLSTFLFLRFWAHRLLALAEKRMQ